MSILTSTCGISAQSDVPGGKRQVRVKLYFFYLMSFKIQLKKKISRKSLFYTISDNNSAIDKVIVRL